MCWTLRAETMLLEHTGLLTVTLNELSYSLVLAWYLSFWFPCESKSQTWSYLSQAPKISPGHLWKLPSLGPDPGSLDHQASLPEPVTIPLRLVHQLAWLFRLPSW